MPMKLSCPSIHSVATQDFELVDEPLLLDHGLEERLLVHRPPEPVDLPLWHPHPALHYREELDVKIRRVRAVQNRHPALETKPAKLIVEDEEGRARGAAQVPCPDAGLGAGTPYLALDQRDADACDVGRPVCPQR